MLSPTFADQTNETVSNYDNTQLLKTTIHLLTGNERDSYETIHVKNITDVGHMRQEMLEQGEDKVIAAAIKEGKTPQEIALFYTNKFLKDEQVLNISPPDYMPKATDHINDMLEMIDTLVQKNIAYQVNQNVYFDILDDKEIFYSDLLKLIYSKFSPLKS